MSRLLLALALAACFSTAALAEPYSRSLYQHWIDEDHDCQDTRQEVLIAESHSKVRLDAAGCKVISGLWKDPYTGETFTDPIKLDIDHFVPLAEAHRSGASAWNADRRRAYANDLSHPDTLIAVKASANRSKGDKDPAAWMPPSAAFHCEYVRSWLGVKQRWNLVMDAAEAEKIREVLADCDGHP